jgi:hypothetical protein
MPVVERDEEDVLVLELASHPPSRFVRDGITGSLEPRGKRQARHRAGQPFVRSWKTAIDCAEIQSRGVVVCLGRFGAGEVDVPLVRSSVTHRAVIS